MQPTYLQTQNYNYYQPIHERKHWHNLWIQWGLQNSLPKAPSKEVNIFTTDGRRTGRKRTIYGASIFHKCPKIVEVTVPPPDSVEDLIRGANRAIETVQTCKPDLKLCPSHSGWSKVLPDGSLRLQLLFSSTGEANDLKSLNYARRNQLDFHLQETSRELGTLNRVAVINDVDSSIGNDDGIIYIKAGAVYTPHINPFKVIAYAYFTVFLQNQKPVIKGMAVFCKSWQWRNLCMAHGVDPDTCDALVPACTIKFHSGEPVLKDMKVFSVFDTISVNHATLSVQAAERMPLTIQGEGIIKATFREAIREVMEAYRDPTGNTVASMLDRDFKEMLERARLKGNEGDCSLTPDDTGHYITKAETFSALMVELQLLPMRGDEFLNATLPVLLRNRTKHVKMPGLTAVALSGTQANLKPGEIYLPLYHARRLKLKTGDRVTIYRYPNTGLEMAEAVITGYTDLSAVFINPDWWADRFSGDFDGDLIGIIPVGGLIDEEAVKNEVSPKQKGKGEMTISEAVARSIYAKYIIPQADMLVTMAAEQGIDLTYPRGILQAIIDSIKHVVDVPGISEMKTTAGLQPYDAVSPVATVIRGRLGNNKRESIFRYNNLVSLMKLEQSSCRWLKDIEKEFCYLLAPNKQLKFMDSQSRVLKDYRQACRDAGYPEIARPEDKYLSARIPDDVLSPHRNRILKMAYHVKRHVPEAVKLAREVTDQWYQFGRLLRDGSVEEAYDTIKCAREKILVEERIGGWAMNYLFAAVTIHGIDTCIRLFPYKVFSYLPVRVGNYDLACIMDRLGYMRNLDIRVIKQ